MRSAGQPPDVPAEPRRARRLCPDGQRPLRNHHQVRFDGYHRGIDGAEAVASGSDAHTRTTLSTWTCTFCRGEIIGNSSATWPGKSPSVAAAMMARLFAAEALLAMIGDWLPAPEPGARVA